jgi:anthranilate phosphoribosyltransferase
MPKVAAFAPMNATVMDRRYIQKGRRDRRAVFVQPQDMLVDLARAAASRELSRDEVTSAMTTLLDPAVDDETKAVFLRGWAQRGETAAELAACAETLLPRAIEPPVRGSWNGKPLLDCCGTGGGGLNLINISTGIVFILAALGVPVVKHGNRGLTKRSGSADVLEALGIRIDLPADKMEACLEKVGAAFLFAPAYHTSFSVLAPVRKRLGAEGQRTVFNLLGPLLTRAHGVLYQATLREMGCPRFTVVYGMDEPTGTSIGEASARGATTCWNSRGGRSGGLSEINRDGDPAASFDQMLVKDAGESAARLEAILSRRERGLARDTLLLNAALAVAAHVAGVLEMRISAQKNACPSRPNLGR